jgi:hypothetical protein
VVRDTGPWTPAVHTLLRHLERVGFDANVTPDMTSHPCALWAMAWRARAAAWLPRNRRPIENALA